MFFCLGIITGLVEVEVFCLGVRKRDVVMSGELLGTYYLEFFQEACSCSDCQGHTDGGLLRDSGPEEMIRFQSFNDVTRAAKQVGSLGKAQKAKPYPKELAATR